MCQLSKNRELTLLSVFGTELQSQRVCRQRKRPGLTAGLREMINDSDFKKNMEELGMAVQYMGPDEFSERWIEDNVKLTKTVRETGIAELIASQKK
ncbi:hypothetical protein SPSIL_026440 [Sporomusa silvacetica DSM 10669]|uniref:Uncharacterized protein n=1 Tax=Sporomusa silvacetica DSM 10669 TaxID=1123289 RepID=A0ABZ3IM41_9FIRM|nr:hypothetical protein [Sporomusa silvacetica]OZC22979.1 hypothetical protein SPSIL_03330 [Sporomusa silvacetica DSM 10669]